MNVTCVESATDGMTIGLVMDRCPIIGMILLTLQQFVVMNAVLNLRKMAGY
jgi:hypothetical protein